MIKQNHSSAKGLIVAAALALVFPTSMPAQTLLPKPAHCEFAKGHNAIARVFSLENADTTSSNAFLTWAKAQGAQTGNAPQKNEQSASRKKPQTPVMKFAALNGNNNEAYSLRVTPDSIIVCADSDLGFLRASQTAAQLLHNGKLACADISDQPAFEWRGAMIDVSRHFFPISFLKKQVDILSRYKINRLHLHLTDAAGWRIEIKRYPRLMTEAAWRTEASWKTWWNEGGRRYSAPDSIGAYGGFYSQTELRDLVAYAAQRGITIVPEIEMPAHSEEVLTAYPEFSCTHEPYKQADFCIGNAGSIDFLEHVLDEVMSVFPSEYIHIGGDEAGMASWPSCPLCQKKLKEIGGKEVKALQSYLIRHMGYYLKQHGRKMIAWDEVIDDNLMPGTTVMVWRNASYAAEATKRGYKAILSPGAFCYLDGYQDEPRTQPEAIGGYLPLKKVYGFNPLESLTQEEQKNVTGVQGNLWTEYVPTPEHAEYMLYPRMLALSEIGWSGNQTKDYADFHARVLKETEWLRTQSVSAFPLDKEKGNRKESLQKALKHKAYGKKVTYNHAFHPNYPAAGEESLTDGLRGGWANTDGRWQGFIGRHCFDVVIDLEKTENIRRVSTDFMQMCGPEIFYPSSFTVSVSTDGKTFKEVYNIQNPSKKTIQPDVRTFEWKGHSVKARYVRLQAEPSSFGGWLFTDEVIVE